MAKVLPFLEKCQNVIESFGKYQEGKNCYIRQKFGSFKKCEC